MPILQFDQIGVSTDVFSCIGEVKVELKAEGTETLPSGDQYVPAESCEFSGSLFKMSTANIATARGWNNTPHDILLKKDGTTIVTVKSISTYTGIAIGSGKTAQLPISGKKIHPVNTAIASIMVLPSSI